MGFMIRTIREQWKRYLFVILDSAQMVVFIAVFIIYFSWIGLRLFKGTIEGIQYFDNFGDAIFNMLVLLTTSNFPDIMMPAYRDARIASLFFIIYLVFGLFLFMNMLLAIFYANYKIRYQKALDSFVDVRTIYLENQFSELDVESKGYLNKQQAYEMFNRIRKLDEGEKAENIGYEEFD